MSWKGRQFLAGQFSQSKLSVPLQVSKLGYLTLQLMAKDTPGPNNSQQSTNKIQIRFTTRVTVCLKRIEETAVESTGKSKILIAGETLKAIF